MKTILITGFEPFGGEAINPSWEAIKSLQGYQVADAKIETCLLPCVFDVALQHLYAAIDSFQPELVISVGQAGGRTGISIERVAINVNDARIPDNAGKQPIDTSVISGGPAAHFSSLPIKTIAGALRKAGIPASVSQTAGTFVCNHVMYGLLHYLAQNTPSTRGGFIHIPYLPEQAANFSDMPSMTLELMTTALRLAIETAWENKSDISVTGGATH
ncbi:pyrrolidone-carboxylate peptidase [Xenorhabdus mauleonii]|uniref:Pyrrolidone-carboxylate peptidase n=1 Tax=Xenorhabdus mauleonii TaxID=351675 RepID=A0A1I3QD66_9GAMM|nr:pyroglutamyl-peptidase I [Xenorhabdus mauleonii]PHM40007.1 pyrrolidone-carboxylate peptidase [Xenorhabdus mauleonii]SFJ31675.1 pyroglutamyl-peptidase I Cysteine peptidase. MEROPS family C15 [Xenorhabdus mauleonii]